MRSSAHSRSSFSSRIAVLSLLALHTAWTPGCSCGGTDASDAGSGAGKAGAGGGGNSGGGTGGGAGVAGGGGGEPDAAACDPVPTSASIPAGWVRMPGLPCECDVWLDPAPEKTPAPGWLTTPPGVLEMEVAWADPAHRFYSGTSVGDAYGSERLLGYLRDLGGDLHEAVVTRLPQNEMVFIARLVKGFDNKCVVRVAALGQGRIFTFGIRALPGIQPAPGVFGIGGPVPATTWQGTAPLVQGFAVDGQLAAIRVAPNTRIDVWPHASGGELHTAWLSNDGRSVVSNTLRAWDGRLFFDLSTGGADSESWTWDAAKGARPFRKTTGTAPGQTGASCGVGTDGKTFVWTESSGWTGTEWADISIYKAAYVTDETKLAPMKVRAAPGGRGTCASWVVSGDYAGARVKLGKKLEDEPEAFVVRLSDGVMWQVPERPGRVFGLPLWIDDGEVALEEGLTIPNDAGVAEFQSWSIVRYPLALLGPGTPP